MMELETLFLAQNKITNLKNQGDEKIKEGDAQTAIRFYTEAIEEMKQHSNIDEQLEAKIWSNRSAAYIKMSSYREALLDAKCAVTAWPEWYKGYIRLSKAHEGLEEYSDSLRMHHKALMLLITHSETNSITPVLAETIVSQCTLICSVIDKDKHLALEYFTEMSRCFITESLICTIAVVDRCDLLLKLLKLDLDDKIVMQFKKLLRSKVKDTFYPSQEEASIAGLQSGILKLADFSNEQAPPLHFAVARAADTESTKLLEYLLNNHFTTKGQVECLDRRGGTILHFLLAQAIVNKNPACSIKVVQCLKKFSHVDFKMKDAHGNSVRETISVEGIPESSVSWLLKYFNSEENTSVKATTHKKLDKGSKMDKGNTSGKSASLTEAPRDENRTDVNGLPEEDAEAANKRLKAEITQLEEQIKTVESTGKSAQSGDSNNNSNKRVIKCTVPETGVKLEVPLCKLPDVLAKLGVIKLH